MLVREVRYVPLLCRLGLHRWACGLRDSIDEFLRRWFFCRDLDLHLHVCRRCGRNQVVGRLPEWRALPAPTTVAEHVLLLGPRREPPPCELDGSPKKPRGGCP